MVNWFEALSTNGLTGLDLFIAHALQHYMLIHFCAKSLLSPSIITGSSKAVHDSSKIRSNFYFLTTVMIKASFLTTVIIKTLSNHGNV